MRNLGAKKDLLGLVVLTGWLLLVIVGYYLYHKPIEFEQVGALIAPLFDLLFAASVLACAGGLGGRFSKWQKFSELEIVVLQAALGLGLFGLFWLSIGSTFGLSKWLSYGVLAVLGVLNYKETLVWVKNFRAGLKQVRPVDSFHQALLLGSAALASLQLLYAVVPPTKWDSLMYHLDMPRRYLESGRLVFLENHYVWGHPQLTEMLYTWMISLRGLETATVLAWLIGCLGLLGLLGFVSRMVSCEGGILAVTALIAGASFRGEMSWGYVDGMAFLLGLGILMITVDLLSREQPTWQTVMPLGIFTGLLLGVKYTTLAVLPIVVVAVLIFYQGSLSRKFSAAAGIIVFSLLLFTPWLVKNLLATGNPLYPYFFPSEWIPAESFAFGARRSPETLALWEILLLPLASTWKGIEGASGYSTDLGPLFILLAAPGLLFQRGSKSGNLVLLWLMGGWVIMAAGSLYSGVLRETRHYLALLPAAGLAAGWGWEGLRKLTFVQVRIGVVYGILVGFVLLTSLWADAVGINARNPVGVLTGQISTDDYLERTLGSYPEAMETLSKLPEGEKVLFLWEPRSLYGPTSVTPDVWIDRWYTTRRQFGDEQQIINQWKEKGYRYLLVNIVGVAFEKADRHEYLPEDWSVLEKMLAEMPVIDQIGDMYTLYSLP